MQRVVSIELNEINFDFVAAYAARGLLPTLARMIDRYQLFETVSEREHPFLEPWIQWPTVYTGKTYAEHGVFRLGDITNTEHLQIWDVLEAQGVSVGAISPMNAANRCVSPDFFVPDPWTVTKTSGDKSLIALSELVRDVVNANAHGGAGIIKTAAGLAPYLLRYAALSSSSEYARILRASKKYKWARAAFLDRFLADVFFKLVAAKGTQFASVFLNAGAHIQHHHMFESAIYEGDQENPTWYSSAGADGVDPLLFVYRVYDGILSDALALPDTRVLVTTGLSQVANPRTIYQHRFIDHASSLHRLGVGAFEIVPRMSRDFLLNFPNAEAAQSAKQVLLGYRCADEPLFTVEDRGGSLFCQIGYFGPQEGLKHVSDPLGETVDLSAETVLVSIENGIHRPIGFHLDTACPRNGAPVRIPLTQLYDRVLGMFEVKATALAA